MTLHVKVDMVGGGVNQARNQERDWHENRQGSRVQSPNVLTVCKHFPLRADFIIIINTHYAHAYLCYQRVDRSLDVGRMLVRQLIQERGFGQAESFSHFVSLQRAAAERWAVRGTPAAREPTRARR